MKLDLLKTATTFTFLIIVIIFNITACKDMDSTFKEYLEGGEIKYVARVDTLIGYPGKNRVKLVWPIGRDSRVTYVQIFWNNYEDSLRVDINKEQVTDSAFVIIEGLEEAGHEFTLLTYDDIGNKSVKANVYVEVYGEIYISTLLNRKVRDTEVGNNSICIDFYPASLYVKNTLVEYSTKNNTIKTLLLEAAEQVICLPDYKPNTQIKFFTTYIPEGNGIDEVATVFDSFIPSDVP